MTRCRCRFCSAPDPPETCEKCGRGFARKEIPTVTDTGLLHEGCWWEIVMEREAAIEGAM